MSMVPSPIHPSAVHVVLQYISPPSQLTQPLPPYLISRDLLQRHHFLQISHENPEEYLCWPSTAHEKSQAIDLLEAVPQAVRDELTAHAVQYTSDGEHTYAHVSIYPNSDEGPRLIFQWNDDGWKYHDTGLMPFPPESRSSVNLESVSAPQKAGLLGADGIQITYSNGGLMDDLDMDDGDDDDDYWNAYGTHDHEHDGYDHRALAKKDTGGGTEDAYWAQYSSVHGTADSTIPSPVHPPHRKPHPVHSEFETHVDTESPNPLPVRTRLRPDDSAEEVLPIPISAIPRRPDVHAKWGGASPRTLAHLLSSVSSRASPASTPAHNSRPSSEYDASSPIRDSDFTRGSDVPLAPLDLSDTELQLESLSGQGTLFEQEPFELDERHLPTSISHKANGRVYDADHRVGNSSRQEVEENDEMALRDSLQGVWRLWKASRQRRTSEDDGGDERERFLRVVQEVIGRE